jgi:Cell wall-active antibiotics response 4TMS YvqF/Domain of unknown function (DUF5668)
MNGDSMNELNSTSATRPVHLVKLVLGISVILVGLLIWLDSLDYLNAHAFWKYFWPGVMIALGCAKLYGSRDRNSVGGWILVGLGVLFLLKNLRIDLPGNLIGPFVLVTVGIAIILNALKQHRGVPDSLKSSENFVSGTSIFGAFKRGVTSQDFQGGELTSIFGGFDVDLRQAVMVQNQARIDIFVLFGGGELRLPEGWDSDVRTTSIFGAVEDKDYRAAAQGEGTRPRLVITGMTLFGGVEIHR